MIARLALTFLALAGLAAACPLCALVETSPPARYTAAAGEVRERRVVADAATQDAIFAAFAELVDPNAENTATWIEARLIDGKLWLTVRTKTTPLAR